jgi:hypothetical protein
VTANDALLAAWPFTVTENIPEDASNGTVPTIDVSLQPKTLTAVPLSETALAPCVAPKLEPAIVIKALTGPEVGDKLDMLGANTTVKFSPLLFTPTFTITSPVVAPLGTITTTLVSLQLVGVVPVPLKLTVLDPCVVPKSLPLMVTAVPTTPEFGDRLVMLGAAA